MLDKYTGSQPPTLRSDASTCSYLLVFFSFFLTLTSSPTPSHSLHFQVFFFPLMASLLHFSLKFECVLITLKCGEMCKYQRTWLASRIFRHPVATALTLLNSAFLSR